MELIPRKFYLDDIFDNIMGSDTNAGTMKCDIYEKEGNYHIEMDVPGFKKENIALEFDKGYLTITAEKKEEDEDENKNYIRRERTYSKIQRSFYIGDSNEELIEANFQNGTLHVMIPKKVENATKKSIEIRGN